MAGSTRNKSDGSGYQREGLKSDYSKRARDSFDKTVTANQRSIGYTPKGDMEQSVNRAAKGSRLAGPKSGTMTSWMGGFTKRAISPSVTPSKPRAKPVAPKAVRKPTQITIPGGGLRSSTAKSSGPAKGSSGNPFSTKEAQGLRAGNYSGKSMTMGGKNYTGFTVSSRTDSKGRTTKSVGNWTSSSNAGRSGGMGGSRAGSSSKSSSGGRSAAGYGGKNDPAGPRR